MYTINVEGRGGFSYCDIIQVREVLDVGDSYNLVTDMGDMWMEKKYCFMVRDDDILRYAEYRGSWMTVYVEEIPIN